MGAAGLMLFLWWKRAVLFSIASRQCMFQQTNFGGRGGGACLLADVTDFCNSSRIEHFSAAGIGVSRDSVSDLLSGRNSIFVFLSVGVSPGTTADLEPFNIWQGKYVLRTVTPRAVVFIDTHAGNVRNLYRREECVAQLLWLLLR